MQKKTEGKEHCCSFKGGCSTIRKDNLPYMLWTVKLRTQYAVDLLFVRQTQQLLSDSHFKYLFKVLEKRCQKHSWESTSQTAEPMFLLDRGLQRAATLVQQGLLIQSRVNIDKLSSSALGNIKFTDFSLTYLKCLMEEFIDFLNYCSSTSSTFHGLLRVGRMCCVHEETLIMQLARFQLCQYIVLYLGRVFWVVFQFD